jgi:hypothetical protein
MTCMNIFAKKLTFLYFFSSPHDTTDCSLMCGPLDILGASTSIGHEQRWLHIGHSDYFSKIMFGECIY